MKYLLHSEYSHVYRNNLHIHILTGYVPRVFGDTTTPPEPRKKPSDTSRYTGRFIGILLYNG